MAAGDRSRERREALRLAARRAVVAFGTDVRLIQVAHLAGVTPGAVLYHYPNLEQLLSEAYHAGIDEVFESRRAAVAELDDPAAQLVALARVGVPADADQENGRLLCELAGFAGRDRVVATLLTSLHDRTVALHEAALSAGRAAGLFRLAHPAGALAQNLVALQSGYTARIVARHPAIDHGRAVALILDYARAAVAHPLGAPTAPTTVVLPPPDVVLPDEVPPDVVLPDAALPDEVPPDEVP